MNIHLRAILIVILLTTHFTAQAQKISGQIEGHNKGEMDIVLTMFGLDNQIKIGTLNADGSFEINLNENPAETLSEEELDQYIYTLKFALNYACGNPEDFPEGEAEIAKNAGHIALWANNTWTGALFPVSNVSLQPWTEDEGYNDAVEGSFYKIILVTEDVILQKNCNATYYNYYNNEDIELNFEYDLQLKKGLNLVEYQLLSIYKTDPKIRASFPIKVRMNNAGENAEIIWMAKYFY